MYQWSPWLAMGTLFLWQLKYFAITQLYEKMLSSYLVHVLFGTKHITGCYGNAVTMATKKLCNNSA